MRNVFDQYRQPENRLSHALAVCLHEDRALLRAFLVWVGATPPTRKPKLMVAEQSLPGELPETDEEEADQKGLPDIVVHDGVAWCLLIESKVRAPLRNDQVERHERTLRRRGFETVHRMILTRADVLVPRGVIWTTWSDLYRWLGRRANRREWPERLRSYLRAAEARLAQEEYLTEGTLTMFDGFSFSADNPYSYAEARRLLKLAMRELRKERSLKTLGMDGKSQGRGAITGRDANNVWDMLQLRDRPLHGPFTRYPHLTLSVHAERLQVAITIPNGVSGSVRQRLADLGPNGLIAMNAEILRGAKRILSRGATVYAYALQRHYLGQRSAGVRDARVEFKLETCQTGFGRVKHQPEWVKLFAELLRSKRSNMQFGYTFDLPWGTRGIDSRESLTLIAGCWNALKPLLAAIRRGPKRQPRRRR